jgi:hypothetical protein
MTDFSFSLSAMTKLSVLHLAVCVAFIAMASLDLVDAQCAAPCTDPSCASYSMEDTYTITTPSCGSSSIALNSLYISDTGQDRGLSLEVCPTSASSSSDSCSSPLPATLVGGSSGLCFQVASNTFLPGTNQLALTITCGNLWESCSFTASVSTTCSPPASTWTSYLLDFNSVCVGDGNTFTKALPCPATASASCAYTISMTASDFVGSPNSVFVVFADSADFSNWNSNQPYNTVAGPVQSTTFNSGVFYVPPGSSYIFVAYNGNDFENMYVSGYIEFYPNTADGSQTSAPSTSASAYASSALGEMELFAFGFFMALHDSTPYSPPTQACLTGMNACFSDAQNLINSANNGAAGSTLRSQLVTLVSDFTSTMKTCNSDSSSCPGFDEQILDDVLQVAVAVIPGVDVIAEAGEALQLMYDAYDLMANINGMVAAYNNKNWYQVGYEAGNIMKEIHSLKDGLTRRAVTPLNGTTNHADAHKANLRHSDGVIRTLQQWRAMFNRTHLAAFDTPTVMAASQMGTGSGSRSGGLSGGAVAGVVIGAVAAVALVALVAVVVLQRRRMQAASATAMQEPLVPEAYTTTPYERMATEA